MEEWSKRRIWGNVEERSKRRDGWSGEMFDWENMEEGEEEEGMKWRKGQRGGTAGVEKCLNGRTWKKVKRGSGGVVRERDNEGSTSTHMMTNLDNVPTRFI